MFYWPGISLMLSVTLMVKVRIILYYSCSSCLTRTELRSTCKLRVSPGFCDGIALAQDKDDVLTN